MANLATLDADLAAAEANVPNLRPDCEKRVVWAGDAGVQTDLAVIFLHGFSATSQEISPVPENVAKALGANLFRSRLRGHGQDGEALAQATVAGWKADVAEALSIAKAIGKKTIIIGCSTGCTLAAIALAEGASAKALVQVSPNFAMSHPLARWLLAAPGVRHWGHLVAGKERKFKPISPAHKQYWTCQYPTKALYTMDEAVRMAKAARLEQITVPTLVALSDGDKVVWPKESRRQMARWGGPVEIMTLTPTATCDENEHIMAGDIFSPAQTKGLVERILDWLAEI